MMWKLTPTPPAIAAIYTRDTYRSAATLALLVLVWGAMNLTLAKALPAPVRAGFSLEMVLAAGAIVYLVHSRRRPLLSFAVGFSLIEIAISVVLVPAVAAAWLSLQRPWDAVLGVQLALISMPLVVPRFVWLGVVMIALFSAEAIGITLEARALGLALPMEAYVSIAFGAHALGHLIVRGRQRSMAARHVLVEGEEVALQRLGPMLTSLRERLRPPPTTHSATLSNGSELAARTSEPPCSRRWRPC